MNRFRTVIAAAVMLLVCCSVCTARAENLKIIAGTSLIEDIVQDLTAGEAEVLTIIRGSNCPGHESSRTTDFVFAAQAGLVLVHDFQKDMPQITGMLNAAHKPDRRLVVLEPKGSWLVPSIQKDAVRDIALALTTQAPERAASIQERAAKRLAKIDLAAAESSDRLAPISGKSVIVAKMQSEFVRWAGTTVAATYDRAESITPGILAGIIDNARGKAIAGVIDNYQSGSETGLPLALELKIPHLVLSNFPGSSEDATDYFSLLRHNIDQLLLLAR